ncbi:MAG: dienelactone hydrolase family protein [Thermomicrobiales bacterium]|nr:dienelactone hydrolase family protein [Thermomicrobiales bacterium]
MDAEARTRDDISMLWQVPDNPVAALVLAHGAGAGMRHKSMISIAEGLIERNIAVLRFNFPYMERGSKRPDTPPVAHAAIRSAVAEANDLASGLPVFAGGKSFGGRMTSQAQSIEPLPNVRGLVFFGFPLHPAGKPGISRADHLANVALPMLFLQGTRDTLAEIDLVNEVVSSLGSRARLIVAEDADHSFHVPAKSGRTDAEVLAKLLDAARDWMTALT